MVPLPLVPPFLDSIETAAARSLADKPVPVGPNPQLDLISRWQPSARHRLRLLQERLVEMLGQKPGWNQHSRLQDSLSMTADAQ